MGQSCCLLTCLLFLPIIVNLGTKFQIFTVYFMNPFILTSILNANYH